MVSRSGTPFFKTHSSKIFNRSTARQAEIEALAALPANAIDTSGIPEVRDWSGAKRGMFYRPMKRQHTLRIDADIVEWFKERTRDGKGYQTNINQALREYVDRHAKQD